MAHERLIIVVMMLAAASVCAADNEAAPRMRAAAPPAATDGAVIHGTDLTVKRGFSISAEGGNTVRVVDANRAAVVTYSCMCNSVDQGGCSVSISGSTASCSSNGCKGACGWSILRGKPGAKSSEY